MTAPHRGLAGSARLALAVRPVALVAALAAGACVPDLAIESTANVACTSDAGCPAHWRCREELGRCVRSDDPDETPPAVASAVYAPAEARAGTLVTATIVTSEPLGRDPELTLEGRPFTLSGADDVRFELVHVVNADLRDGPGELRARLIDRAGNLADVALGTVTVDNTPPALASFAWDNLAPLGPASTVGFSARSEPDVQVGATLLVDDTPLDVTRFVTTREDPAGSGDTLVEGTLPLGALALPAGAQTAVIELEVGDRLGNRALVRGTARTFDGEPPQVAITAGPEGPITDVEVAFAFTSTATDLSRFECSLDGAPWEVCLSPRVFGDQDGLALGEHSFAVRAVDEADNPSASPASRTFVIHRAFAQIDRGQRHACAVATDRSLWCWGANSSFQLGTGTDRSSAAPMRVGTGASWDRVAVGDTHSCALARDGSLWCWGDGAYGEHGLGEGVIATVPVRVGEASDWISLAAATYVTCGVRADGGGTLYCWGYNGSGRLGIPDLTGNAATPMLLAGEGFAAVVCGSGVACALKTDATLHCWGEPSFGVTGVGPVTAIVSSPTPVAGQLWRQVALGAANACGVRSGGELYCWGLALDGAPSGLSTIIDAPARVGIESDWQEVAVGYRFVCARRGDGSIACFGSDRWGELGDGTASAGRTQPVDVAGGPYATLAASANGVCAVGEDGAAFCWGNNEGGSLGIGVTATDALLPRPLPGSGWEEVGLTAFAGCARRTDRTLACWGRNDDGETGVGSTAVVAAPAAPVVETGFVQIAGGVAHTCGIREAGGARTLWCWGSNDSGQLGDALGDRSVPTQVGNATDWAQVACGRAFTCGIRDGGGGGELLCFGENGAGQLGLGAPSAAFATGVVDEPGPADWLSVALGGDSACGLRGAGELWCWGVGDSGQLGDGQDGTDIVVAAPARVGTAADWVQLTASRVFPSAALARAGFACGIRDTLGARRLWCWGHNGAGAMGQSALFTTFTTPVQVGSDTDWLRVEAGGGHTCGVKVDGSLYCWGSGGSGELGIGVAGLYRTEPTWVDDGPVSSLAASPAATCAVFATGGVLACFGSNASGQLGDGTLLRATPSPVAFPPDG